LQMLEDDRMGKRRNSAALRFRDVRMQLGEGADVQLVDQAARPEQRRPGRHEFRQRASYRLRHPRGSVSTLITFGGKTPVVLVRPVDLDRIGIGEQLVRIEPEAALRRVVAVGAKTIARARGKAWGGQ